MSRLGRNPFEQKPMKAMDFVRAAEPTREDRSTPPVPPVQDDGAFAKFTKFLVVDLRAESYVFGLKAYLLSLSIFD